jgi:hypothetical protein
MRKPRLQRRNQRKKMSEGAGGGASAQSLSPYLGFDQRKRFY